MPCYPFGCEPGTTLCRASCQLTAECAPGAVCDQKTPQCVVATYHCADAFTVESAGGQPASRSPYRCSMGSCRATCNGPTDCADGHDCVDGRCRKP
ncbi:MAG: hypothetical protein IPH76_09485 [Xanthomonadales bacterium]|nr:hypothetical protein [Xanthomonadales bacterium]